MSNDVDWRNGCKGTPMTHIPKVHSEYECIFVFQKPHPFGESTVYSTSFELYIMKICPPIVVQATARDREREDMHVAFISPI